MNRLGQGDVGSGKTMVAAAGIYFAAKNGLQTAFLVPTEILARQHFASLRALMSCFSIETVLLTGSAGQAERERGLKGVRAGNVTGNGAFVTAHVAEHLQSGGENEEFLENKARPRLHQRLARGWRVDGLIGELHAAELIFRPDGFRENFRKCAETGVSPSV